MLDWARLGWAVCSLPLGGELARIFRYVTAEAHGRSASTWLRWLAVLDGLFEYARARQIVLASYGRAFHALRLAER